MELEQLRSRSVLMDHGWIHDGNLWWSEALALTGSASPRRYRSVLPHYRRDDKEKESLCRARRCLPRPRSSSGRPAREVPVVHLIVTVTETGESAEFATALFRRISSHPRARWRRHDGLIPTPVDGTAPWTKRDEDEPLETGSEFRRCFVAKFIPAVCSGSSPCDHESEDHTHVTLDEPGRLFSPATVGRGDFFTSAADPPPPRSFAGFLVLRRPLRRREGGGSPFLVCR
jgi:hypothetical protein